jgi:hypothetical protein
MTTTKKEKYLFSLDRDRHDIINELAGILGTSLSNLVDDDVIIVERLAKINQDQRDDFLRSIENKKGKQMADKLRLETQQLLDKYKIVYVDSSIHSSNSVSNNNTSNGNTQQQQRQIAVSTRTPEQIMQSENLNLVTMLKHMNEQVIESDPKQAKQKAKKITRLGNRIVEEAFAILCRAKHCNTALWNAPMVIAMDELVLYTAQIAANDVMKEHSESNEDGQKMTGFFEMDMLSFADKKVSHTNNTGGYVYGVDDIDIIIADDDHTIALANNNGTEDDDENSRDEYLNAECNKAKATILIDESVRFGLFEYMASGEDKKGAIRRPNHKSRNEITELYFELVEAQRILKIARDSRRGSSYVKEMETNLDNLKAVIKHTCGFPIQPWVSPVSTSPTSPTPAVAPAPTAATQKTAVGPTFSFSYYHIKG